MEYDGTETVPAPRDRIWDPITDPEVLTSCIMGAKDVTRVSERSYEGVVEQRVAGVGVSMVGSVAIEELDRPERLVFTGSGTDERTGSRMDAEAEVVLSEADDRTELAYDIDVTFTGKLATLGGRLLRRQVKSNVDTYFENLAEHLGE
jgi:carbon monoxide dehydrogenase subunit G